MPTVAVNEDSDAGLDTTEGKFLALARCHTRLFASTTRWVVWRQRACIAARHSANGKFYVKKLDLDDEIVKAELCEG